MMDNMLSIHPLNGVSLNDGAATVLPGLCPSHALIVDVVRQVEWSVHDVGHEGLVPLHGKRLGEEVSEIVGFLLPCDDKVTLVNAVAQPVKSDTRQRRQASAGRWPELLRRDVLVMN